MYRNNFVQGPANTKVTIKCNDGDEERGVKNVSGEETVEFAQHFVSDPYNEEDK